MLSFGSSPRIELDGWLCVVRAVLMEDGLEFRWPREHASINDTTRRQTYRRKESRRRAVYDNSVLHSRTIANAETVLLFFWAEVSPSRRFQDRRFEAWHAMARITA